MQKIALQIVYGFIVKAFLKVFVGVSFRSAKFLLNEEQFIIVANHNSHLDTMTVMSSLPLKLIPKVKPVAAADHFGKTKFKERLTNYFVNALLIKRRRDKEHPENDPINQMIDALDKGYSLILFPEGTRGQPEVRQPLQPGVAYVLAQRPQVKYVPAYMKGMGKAMPKNDSLIVPYNCTLVYGEPALVKSIHVSDILHQIDEDLIRLKEDNHL